MSNQDLSGSQNPHLQLKKYVDRSGAKNHLEAFYVSEIAKAAYKFNKKRLQTTITVEDTVPFAICNRMVQDFFKKHPEIKLTKDIMRIEQKDQDITFTNRGSYRKLQFKHDFMIVKELLQWNDTVKEERIRLESEREQAEKQKQAAEDLRLQNEEEEKRRLKQLEIEKAWKEDHKEKQEEPNEIEYDEVPDEEEEAEREEKKERAKSVKIITTERAASLEGGSWGEPTIRIIQKTPASLLPAGSRNPPLSRGPKSPNAKSVMQVSFPAGSVYGGSRGEARSVASSTMRRRIKPPINQNQ
ncbi:hypothetical protein TVAG_495350 [Trichomonas vaginalis G3]|uniref:Uncharacterized protein n=1 Tax=Trichomonas vaginalis (strain ATCC PRA-98 / G3) TaxID=412133 RepID=A2DVH8_TRIV3|nr:hypothetical protein TVAGG3_0275360 [Trichomonas vaginalis G3]EAY15520.1 hypothetical protein TVAG_495350 [Trichomonas vaginalis G3]KAI5526166.1 hypothetical protein TVAGG3_0275360 [Trichomonas vaginalis G3]|eukprot:XP_001327743.1 hypothetical protein [Trichomonas vaginalis G3]